MTKKFISFLRKKVTPSVTAPGDTNPSDATVRWCQNRWPWMTLNCVMAVILLSHRIS